MNRGHFFFHDGMQSFPYSVGGGKLAYGDWDELCNVVYHRVRRSIILLHCATVLHLLFLINGLFHCRNGSEFSIETVVINV